MLMINCMFILKLINLITNKTIQTYHLLFFFFLSSSSDDEEDELLSLSLSDESEDELLAFASANSCAYFYSRRSFGAFFRKSLKSSVIAPNPILVKKFIENLAF